METDLLRQLYQKYHRELYLYLYSLCKNRELAEDLLQETFLKALLSLSEKHTNMRAWLYLVARNLYFNYLKKEKNKLPIDEIREIANDSEPDLIEKLIADERKHLCYQALQKLKGQKKEVLILHYFGEMSQKEIATVLQLTPENVRVLAYRGKRELKKIMEENNYDIP